MTSGIGFSNANLSNPILLTSSVLFRSKRSVQAPVSTEVERSEGESRSTFFFPNHHIKIDHFLQSMTCINDSLSPDLFFNTFKRLDCIETTRIRRVCKQWFEIIDEHKSFWRVLHLPHDRSSRDSQSLKILDLFGRKSGSTLQDVDIGGKVEKKLRHQFCSTLEKSKETLEQLVFILDYLDDDCSELLMMLNQIESLRVILYRSRKIRLRRTSIKRDSQEDGSNTASPLKVLWHHGAGRSILEITSDRFNNLISLDLGSIFSSSEWRKFLEGPSKSLKHLKIGFKNGTFEDHSGVPTLDFPNLEMLELIDGGRFPQWLLILDTLKLITLHPDISNLPSVSEIWGWAPTNHRNDIVNRLPKLKTLSFGYMYVLENVTEMLSERKANVEAGLQVDGVRMEMIKTVVLPYDLSNPHLSYQERRRIRRFQELVKVVEGDAQSRFIEVEF